MLTVVSRREAVKALIGGLASPERRDRAGKTALLLAIEHNQPDVAAYLVTRCSADVNAPDNHQTTPLMMACIHGQAETVELLLQHGADTQLKDDRGRTALQLSQQTHHDHCYEKIAATQIIGSQSSTISSPGAVNAATLQKMSREQLIETVLTLYEQQSGRDDKGGKPTQYGSSRSDVEEQLVKENAELRAKIAELTASRGVDHHPPSEAGQRSFERTGSQEDAYVQVQNELSRVSAKLMQEAGQRQRADNLEVQLNDCQQQLEELIERSRKIELSHEAQSAKNSINSRQSSTEESRMEVTRLREELVNAQVECTNLRAQLYGPSSSGLHDLMKENERIIRRVCTMMMILSSMLMILE